MVIISRKVKRAGRVFMLKFDNDGILDTVDRFENDMKHSQRLNGAHRDAQFFVRHQEKIHSRVQVKGIEYMPMA